MTTTLKHLALWVRRAYGGMPSIVVFVLCVWVASAPVYSARSQFLREAPVSFFNEEDVRLFKEAVHRTLEKVPDGEISSWQNPATESAGVMKPIKTYQDNGTTCRTLEILNRAAGRTRETEFDFCKQPDGKWKLES
jgi:surface antigen